MCEYYKDDNFPNQVAKLCYELFEKLPKTGKPKPNEWTVLSCILQSNIEKNLQIVSLGTGSKCIGQTKLDNTGIILNDSHAEVLARRGFIRYIYEQIEYALKSEDSIFSLNEHKEISLKPDIHFHFFSSHLPCGDASILKNNEISIDEFPLVQNTGAKCVDNDLDSTNDRLDPLLGQVRTKPGRGDPTLSVSCSDKLARWIRLGFQGALIDILLNRPLTVQSIIIANDNPLCKDSLNRALFNRTILDKEEDENYLKPLILQTDIMFKYGKSDDKEPSFTSIVWCKVKNKSLEVAVEGKKLGVTKKLASTDKAALMISKKCLFSKFVSLFDLLNETLRENLKKRCDGENLSYFKIKKSSLRYYQKWNHVKKNFFKSWPKKPKKDFDIVKS